MSVRLAVPDDAVSIHAFITELAIYENEPNAVDATPDSLRIQMQSGQPPFEALIAEVENQPIGFALFFSNYSTWEGKPGTHLEDLFVSEVYRGRGVGTKLLAELSRLTIERGGARLDWQVLDWNEPSIRYYESVGADVLRSWLPCRLDGEALRAMASR